MNRLCCHRRTADYVAALIREGDNLDYYRWLQEARAEETQAKQRPQPPGRGAVSNKYILAVKFTDAFGNYVTE